MRNAWLLVLVLGGCWTSKQSETPPPKTDVNVELAAVTLADDCSDDIGMPPPQQKRVASVEERSLPASPAQDSAPARRAAPAAMAVPADCAGPNCGGYYHCEPTSMQLSVRSTTSDATTITVKKVELLDKNGKVLGELTARTPSKWTGSAYEAWDQQVAPNSAMQTSYRLSAPQWHSFLSGGRYEAHTKTYQLRVTVTVGNAERTVEKKAISVAMMEPPVPT